MKLRPNGWLYLTGSTDSSGMIAVGNAYATTNTGIANIFLAIVDTTQASYPLLYLSYFGGTGTDLATLNRRG